MNVTHKSLSLRKSIGLLVKSDSVVSSMQTATSEIDKLGLSQDMVGMFTPILVDFVDKKACEAVGGLLQKVFTK